MECRLFDQLSVYTNGDDGVFDMVLLNIWSLGHFIQWTFIGRYLLRNWWIFIFLSVGWEVLELYLPYEFVKETWDNKISDLVVNTIGFAIGKWIRYDPETLQSNR